MKTTLFLIYQVISTIGNYSLLYDSMLLMLRLVNNYLSILQSSTPACRHRNSFSLPTYPINSVL